jgi:hypothetical protein
MNKSKCPHCGIELGNYLYANTCPHCSHELEHNTQPLVSSAAKQVHTERAWPILMFFRMVRFVES